MSYQLLLTKWKRQGFAQTLDHYSSLMAFLFFSSFLVFYPFQRRQIRCSTGQINERVHLGYEINGTNGN